MTEGAGRIAVTVRMIAQKRRRRVKLQPGARVLDLLKLLNQNPETVVVRLNGRIVAEEEQVVDGDLVELLPIVTGGSIAHS